MVQLQGSHRNAVNDGWQFSPLRTIEMAAITRNVSTSATIRCSTMAIPDFQSFFVPVLRQTADGADHSMAELRDGIATDLNLTPEELSLKLPSGTQTVFANRIAW